MLAYNNDPSLKAALLDQIRKHREMDQIVQGTYGKDDNDHWRGCSIACSLRSLDIVRGNDVAEEYNAHHRYPAELGIPLELAYLKERLFENLPIQIAREWPERFAAAIVPGADLSGVWPRFALWSLIDPEYGMQRYADDIGRRVILAVAALFQRRLDGDEPAAKEWRAAAEAAYVTADTTAAFDAFDAAAEATDIAEAANIAARYVAEAAAHAAYAAAEAADTDATIAYAASRTYAAYAAGAADAAAAASYAIAYAAADDDNTRAVAYAAYAARAAVAAATDADYAYIQPMADKLVELLGSAR